MPVAPKLHAVVAGEVGIVLPEIEVNAVIFGRRQGAGVYGQGNFPVRRMRFVRGACGQVCVYRNFIIPRLRVFGDADVRPDGGKDAAVIVLYGLSVEYVRVGNTVRVAEIPFRIGVRFEGGMYGNTADGATDVQPQRGGISRVNAAGFVFGIDENLKGRPVVLRAEHAVALAGGFPRPARLEEFVGDDDVSFHGNAPFFQRRYTVTSATPMGGTEISAVSAPSSLSAVSVSRWSSEAACSASFCASLMYSGQPIRSHDKWFIYLRLQTNSGYVGSLRKREFTL